VLHDPNGNSYSTYADTLFAFYSAMARVEQTLAFAARNARAADEAPGAEVALLESRADGTPLLYTARDGLTGFAFLAVPVAEQAEAAEAVRRAVPQFCKLGASDAAPLHVVQVVGGMVPLSRTAQEAAVAALNAILARCSDRTVLVNHGYSGYLFDTNLTSTHSGDIVDVNTLLSKVIAQTPNGPRLSLPNLVNNHAESHHNADPARPLGGPVACPHALLVFDPARPMVDVSGKATLRYGRDMPLTDALCNTLVWRHSVAGANGGRSAALRRGRPRDGGSGGAGLRGLCGAVCAGLGPRGQTAARRASGPAAG
jgi:hypothetical protein